jgi:hypothetical protein
MKKVYKVSFSFDLYLIADSEADAKDNAREYVEDEVRLYNPEAVSDVSEVTSLDGVSAEWQGSLPYGDDPMGDRTLKTILETPEERRWLT